MKNLFYFIILAGFLSGQSALAVDCPAKKFENFWEAYRIACIEGLGVICGKVQKTTLRVLA
jgi:hypothetical protein